MNQTCLARTTQSSFLLSPHPFSLWTNLETISLLQRSLPLPSQTEVTKANGTGALAQPPGPTFDDQQQASSPSFCQLPRYANRPPVEVPSSLTRAHGGQLDSLEKFKFLHPTQSRINSEVMKVLESMASFLCNH